jgi:hypothetical protein
MISPVNIRLFEMNVKNNSSSLFRDAVVKSLIKEPDTIPITETTKLYTITPSSVTPLISPEDSPRGAPAGLVLEDVTVSITESAINVAEMTSSGHDSMHSFHDLAKASPATSIVAETITSAEQVSNMYQSVGHGN